MATYKKIQTHAYVQTIIRTEPREKNTTTNWKRKVTVWLLYLFAINFFPFYCRHVISFPSAPNIWKYAAVHVFKIGLNFEFLIIEYSWECLCRSVYVECVCVCVLYTFDGNWSWWSRWTESQFIVSVCWVCVCAL